MGMEPGGDVHPNARRRNDLSYNHQSQSLSVVGTNPIGRDTLGAAWTQLYPQTNITNSVPDLNTGVNGVGYSLGDPGWHNWGKDYGATENVTLVHGAHTAKFGVFYNRDDKAQTGTWGMEGSVDFSSNAANPLDTGQRRGQPHAWQLLQLFPAERGSFPVLPLLGVRRLRAG